MEFIRIFVYVSIYVGLVATSFYILSVLAYNKKKRELYSDVELPKVSVLIPAYNEEKTIVKTLKSILDSNYPDFEVIVIDDGSKDDTYTLATKFENNKVKVFTKKNGGKASALNFGIKKARGEIIFTMDADTFVAKESMKNMVRYFGNRKIMSVTPAMTIANPKNILQRVQYIEYLLGLFLRKAFASLDSIYISPGAFSAYRKSFFEKYGGYDEGNITEDLEMALRIQSKGFSTENCSEAPAYTFAPSKFKDLMIQRRRWYFGLIKNISNYRHIFSKKYGDLGVFVLPVAWISIFFAVFVTCYFFVKAVFEAQKEFAFLNSIHFDFSGFFSYNSFAIWRAILLFFTNPIILFILVFVSLTGFYLYYASRKIKNVNLLINLPLFYALFSVLFGFWWVVSIFYSIFKKDVNWR